MSGSFVMKVTNYVKFVYNDDVKSLGHEKKHCQFLM